MSLFDRIKQVLHPEHGTGKSDTSNPWKGTGRSEEIAAARLQLTEMESDRKKRLALLTPRERDLYLLLLEGLTLKECAKKLSIKYSTANTHMTSVYKKLAVNSRAELLINYRNNSIWNQVM